MFGPFRPPPAPAPTATPDPEPGTPAWWLLRLLRRLEARAPDLRVWANYYEGVQPLAFASQKFEEAFGDRFPAFTSNFCSLVVEATADRLQVQGFRFRDPVGDADAWAIWQENDLDATSQLAHVETLIKGTSYALVEPNGSDIPVITIEDALDAVVELDPKNRRRRLAGLKRWTDEQDRLVCVVYLPDAVYKYRTKNAWRDPYPRWWWQPGRTDLEPGEFTEGKLWKAAAFEPYQPDGDDDWPLANPMAVVPLIPLPNRPRLRGDGQSEVKPIRSNQDAVNKYRTDALIASEFAAYPQRYLLNYEPDTDETTGRPKAPFQAAIDRLWTVPPPDPDIEGAPEPKFGQFQAASLEPYERMIGMEVGHIASISRLPFHELFHGPTSVAPSGEQTKSSESGLEHKVARARLFLGDGWEEVLRCAFLARGDRDRGKQRNAETIWMDSATRNEAVRTDSIVKLHSQGIIDDELAWELAGLSPEQQRRLKERQAAAAAAGEPDSPPPDGGSPAAGDLQAPGPQLAPAPTGPRMGA